MAAYLVAHSNVLDPQALDEYIAKSGVISARYGSELVTVGEVAEVLVGEFAYKRTAVFRFPDSDSLDRWFHSPEYQALAELRGRATQMVFLKVAEYPGLFDKT